MRPGKEPGTAGIAEPTPPLLMIPATAPFTGLRIPVYLHDMVILSAAQLHAWDRYTIEREPISSIDLMEKAAAACVRWMQQHNLLLQPCYIFCGKGNNGGDGLAIARMLAAKNVAVHVYILDNGQQGTPDFNQNLNRLEAVGILVNDVKDATAIPGAPGKNGLVIDALFGTGLNRPLSGLAAGLVTAINSFGLLTVSIDMPSGMRADESSGDTAVIKAAYTLSFQCLKMAFLMAENEPHTGQVVIMDIGLPANFLTGTTPEALLLEETLLKGMYRPRQAFSHKGTYGHAALVAGSFGSMGASTLSANACLRAGVGKLTCHIPACGYTIMQLAAPEALCKTSGTDFIASVPDPAAYDAIGTGPGLGVTDSHATLLEQLFTGFAKPMVVDADALNVMAKHIALLETIPPFSLLTPHPGEFDRLFGKSSDDFARMRLAREKARVLNVIIILKGHRTLIAMPGGNCFFNPTGNAGMATGGSGDVLTGILTALLAQRYPPEQAALLGVYLHGLAGDFAAADQSQEALIAADIYQHLGAAFRQISGETAH